MNVFFAFKYTHQCVCVHFYCGQCVIIVCALAGWRTCADSPTHRHTYTDPFAHSYGRAYMRIDVSTAATAAAVAAAASKKHKRFLVPKKCFPFTVAVYGYGRKFRWHTGITVQSIGCIVWSLAIVVCAFATIAHYFPRQNILCAFFFFLSRSTGIRRQS